MCPALIVWGESLCECEGDWLMLGLPVKSTPSYGYRLETGTLLDADLYPCEPLQFEGFEFVGLEKLRYS